MSVYYKERPEYLQQSMESILHQTIPASDFVLVCDGPLTAELDAVIDTMQKKFGPVLHVHRLEKNGGLGKALNAGLEQCKYELVARMDSDDISRPDRCEKQLQVFAAHPEYSLVSGIVEEFDGDIHQVTGRRVVPETQKEILQFAKKRNPFNHPCIMYKKVPSRRQATIRTFICWKITICGSVSLRRGYIGYNIQKPLLWMRAGSAMYKRRGGWKYVESQIHLFHYMQTIGFISFAQFIEQGVLRFTASLIPNNVRKLLFMKFLRLH